MNTKTEEQPIRLNAIKWVVIIALIVAGIIANGYLATQPAALRLAGWVVLLVVALLIAYQTVQGQQVWFFLQEARTELRKVVWPTRPEIIQTTLIVIAVVAVMALFLWGVDSTLLWLVGLLTGQRG